MQQKRSQQQRLFAASEVAEFEYCPLVWWHEQFEPAVQANNEELFARLVELEHEHATQAPAIPEYQMIEQLLVKRGAFDMSGKQQSEQDADLAEIAVERAVVPTVSTLTRPLLLVVTGVFGAAVVFLLAALALRTILGNVLFPIGLCLLVLALALLILLLNDRRHQERRLIDERNHALGLPAGELVYENVDEQGETLQSEQYALIGKPSYIVQLPDGRPVPLELKRTVHDATLPASNHEVQLAAYCLILEEYFPETPPTHGILRYADCEFTVDYTPLQRKKVLRFVEQMAKCDEQQPPPLASQKAVKCRACTFQPVCPVGRGK